MRRIGLILTAAAMLVGMSAGADKTYTGVVSDAMCGAKHMGGSAKDCVVGCVKGGSDYALVVGDKVYKLKGQTDKLKDYAGDKVTVKGTQSGDTITVASVAAAK